MAAMLERVSDFVRANAPRPRRLRTLLATALLTVAAFGAAAQLRPDHPDSYVVKRGDTLWDIAGRFLQRPWLWPEIWQANPQIKNPHLIYPGDVISLAYTDRVGLQAGPRTDSPVSAVPLAEIEPFLKDLRVVDSLDGLPYVVGLEEDRMRGSNGQVAYISGLDGIAPGQRYLVVRPEKRYRHVDRSGYCCDLFQSEDLDARGEHMAEAGTMWSNIVFPSKTTEFIGYELMTQSTGTVTRGEVDGIQASTLLLDSEGREVRVGDRLVPVEGGPHDVIALSGGSAQGIDNGTVFSVWRRGQSRVDRVRTDLDRDEDTVMFESKVRMPDEFAGHAMVFRTFDKVSYALVMSSVKPTRVGYELKHPDAPY